MSICAPKPFGSKFLKGGYGYWPLWWYGQKSKLHDMSGHGLDLTPSGAYFDGQGYYFDGSDDYLADAGGRRILHQNTKGSWHSVYLTENEVPTEGSARGIGTKLYFNVSGTSPKLTGKIVLHPEHCPNLTHLGLYYNSFSVVDVGGLSTLIYTSCSFNNVSYFNIIGASSLQKCFCSDNNISYIKTDGLTSLLAFVCNDNNISSLNASSFVLVTDLRCHNNNMNQSAVDAVLCDMASHTTENGGLNISGNELPSSDGEDCRDILAARGWSVTTD
ncbi:hypothetical protein DRN85_08265 [Methanosarcinales archaeon]|nr:MAG: hypothetical protein DRN85_08265 [Methanosarcinales archaeon]